VGAVPIPFPPPGWYADPVDPRWWRWWDGSAWTAHVAPARADSGTRVWADTAYASETKMAPWAKATTFVYPALAVAVAFVNLATASAWKAYFHSVRVFFDSVGATGPPPRLAHAPPWANLLIPFSLAAQVLFLIWQYRAATTARRLGYPARRSPGLGVGSYFIPIVQLWFPYQSLRDCLPPDSEYRRSVLHVWLLLIVTGIINATLVISLAEARPLGVALLAMSVALEAILAVSGYRMVQAITVTHARALTPT